MTNVDDFLEHHGVLGMKWGKRRSGGASSTSTAGKSRSELRALNKASLKKDMGAHADSVQAARDTFNSGAARKRYLDAKAKYKQDKMVIGKREAAKAFNKVKEQNINDYNTSQQYKNGKEAAVGILVAVGATVLLSALAHA